MTCIVADVVVTNLYFGTKVLTFLLLPKLFALKFSVVHIKLFPFTFHKFFTLGKDNVFLLLSLTRNFG